MSQVRTCGAVFRTGNGTSFAQVPVPSLGPRDVRLAVLAASVCGTDRQILRGDRPDAASILGHEGVCRVIEIGPEVQLVRVGETFVCNPVNPDDQDEILGHSTPGLFQELVTWSEDELRRRSLLVAVDGAGNDELPFEVCALAEPLGTVLYTHELLAGTGEAPRRLAIFGDGSMGVLHALFAAEVCGVSEVLLFSVDATRAAWLRTRRWWPRAVRVFGPDETEPKSGQDTVVVCTPARASDAVLTRAVARVAPEGRIVLVGGVGAPGHPALPGMDLRVLRRTNVCGRGQPSIGRALSTEGKRLAVFGHRGTAARHLAGAVALLRDWPVFREILTHCVPVEGLPAVLDTVSHTRRLDGVEYLKAAVRFPRAPSP